MSGGLNHLALRTPGRRLVFALGVLAVAALHGWVALLFEALRADWGAVAAMPQRLQVAYVRELAPTQTQAPVAIPAPRPRALRQAAASAPDSTAQPPEVQAAPEPTVAAAEPPVRLAVAEAVASVSLAPEPAADAA